MFQDYDLVQLKEPNPYKEGCFTGADDKCAIPTLAAWIGARKDLEPRAPKFYAALGKVKIPLTDIEAMLNQVDQEKKEPADVAQAWIDEHKTEIDKWLASPDRFRAQVPKAPEIELISGVLRAQGSKRADGESQDCADDRRAARRRGGRPDLGSAGLFVEADGGVSEAYCLTLVEGLGVDETLRRLAADTSRSTTVGLNELIEEAYEGYDDPAGEFVGAAETGAWTLLVEPNGFGGTRKKRMKKVSKATTAVTIYSNVNYHNEFIVWQGGARQLSFDMMFPEDRLGEDVERFNDDLRRLRPRSARRGRRGRRSRLGDFGCPAGRATHRCSAHGRLARRTALPHRLPNP